MKAYADCVSREGNRMTLTLDRPTTRPNPWADAPFYNPAVGGAQRYSVAVYLRYKALSAALHERYKALLVEASRLEGDGELPVNGDYAEHLAHNWHLCAHGETCPTSRVLLRKRRLDSMLF